MSGPYSFQSQGERDLYYTLVRRKDKEEIKTIQIQDHVYLTRARICYVADFRVVMKDDEVVWLEFKGIDTPEWRIKKRLWEHYGPGRLLIYGPNGTSYRHRDTIILREEIKPNVK